MINKLMNRIKISAHYPHYRIQRYIDHFTTASSDIVIADFAHYDVQNLLKESMLLITDYSSVFFDFAYI